MGTTNQQSHLLHPEATFSPFFTHRLPSKGIVRLSFSNDGSKLHAVSTKGMVSEMNSKNGELLKVLELSKESIISKSFCSKLWSYYFFVDCASSTMFCSHTSISFYKDEKILTATTSHVRVFGLEDGNELVKFPADSGSVWHISVSDDAKAIITSDLDKNTFKCGSVNGARELLTLALSFP